MTIYDVIFDFTGFTKFSLSWWSQSRRTKSISQTILIKQYFLYLYRKHYVRGFWTMFVFQLSYPLHILKNGYFFTKKEAE